MRVIKVCRLELLVEIFDLLALDAMRDLCVEAISRADDSDFRVGIEKIQDAASCYLGCVSTSTACACDRVE